MCRGGCSLDEGRSSLFEDTRDRTVLSDGIRTRRRSAVERSWVGPQYLSSDRSFQDEVSYALSSCCMAAEPRKHSR